MVKILRGPLRFESHFHWTVMVLIGFQLFAIGVFGAEPPDTMELGEQSSSSLAEQGMPPGMRRPGMFTTEVWLTPLILLPGVALLIVSTSARFSQLHTEFHRLVDHPDAHARILSRHLLRRSQLFRNALVALYASVGLFACGSLLGGVVNFWRPESLWVVGSSTMTGIGCVVYASLELTREALICLQVVVDHADRLSDID